MPGSFGVSGTVLAGPQIKVSVCSQDGYKGTVNMSYGHQSSNPPPPSGMATSGSIGVPKDGCGEQLIDVTCGASGSFTFTISGSDGTQTSGTTVVVNCP